MPDADEAAGPSADAQAWDLRVERALASAPRWLQRHVEWLRHPPRRWVRRCAGVLLVVGGCLSILPVLGLWMLPLGLALLGEDMPGLKGWLERRARVMQGLVRRVWH